MIESPHFQPIVLEDRLALLSRLRNYIESNDEQLQESVALSYVENRWFTPDNIRQALNAVCTSFLDNNKLRDWAADYKLPDIPDNIKSIGLVMAGNIPLVGFHDVLCIFVSGHRAFLKCSDKDKRLLPLFINKMVEWNPNVRGYFTFSEMLQGMDAYIATGSNNSAMYFSSYFEKYPHIIRKNRNAVAVLNGKETKQEMIALGVDIFSYFGLGCRNVSKIYIPRGFELNTLLEVLHEHFKEVVTHDKYKNNFDYNYTLYLLNKVKFLATGSLLLTEDKSLHSRIASLHYEYYDDSIQLTSALVALRDEIQCVVSKESLSGIRCVKPGTSQQPGLRDYADGVDVIEFLSTL
jgi:hypothetical protein